MTGPSWGDEIAETADRLGETVRVGDAIGRTYGQTLDGAPRIVGEPVEVVKILAYPGGGGRPDLALIFGAGNTGAWNHDAVKVDA